MTHDYSEDNLIERSSMNLLAELGWTTANGMRGETFGPTGSFGRNSEADALLPYRVLAALRKFNPGLPDKVYAEALEQLTLAHAAKPLAELNSEKYTLLTEGIPVTFQNAQGHRQDKKLRLFDFDKPAHNDWLAVQQLYLEGKSKRRKRPDIVGFVNGVPLLFVELKAHHRKLEQAYNGNLNDYRRAIAHLFHHNAFVILSNGIESKIGSATAPFGYYNEWKRISEDAEGVVSLETMLRGVCDPARFLDLFENFILFDRSGSGVNKIIARNHQYLGVNKALHHFSDLLERAKNGSITAEDRQRLGVFWHTQGSGKSFSMVFFCQKLLRKIGGGYTFVLVTDRNELDKQIYTTFANVGAVKDDKTRASSGAKLEELLRTDSRYIFTLIHKFNFEKQITERDDIIVISDEAHRTQGGSLAMNMRTALPNAAFIGFTGTPLFKDDELTKRIFGDYVSVYDFKRSIEDGATVPLYYENRGEKLELDNPEINEAIRAAIEEADLDPLQEEKLQRLFARDYPILTSKKRLRSIAADVVQHFNTRGYKGKAMFVALDKVTAVKMYDFIAEAWDEWLTKQQDALAAMPEGEDRTQAEADYEWAKETEIAVVVSQEQNEIDKFEAWELDIEPHRLKMNTRDLEKEFKDEDHPFRIAIVCAMWITGFDVKSLSTLYIDKPLKSHTLMQTIARANRVHTGKNNGLIVDYIETYKALLEALAVYAVGGTKTGGKGGGIEAPVAPIEELVEALREAVELCDSFLRDELKFDLQSIIDGVDFEKIAAIARGADAVFTSDEIKERFGVLARDVFKKYKAVIPREEAQEFRPRRDAIDAIYRKVADTVGEADVSHVMKRVQDVVDDSIESINMMSDRTEDYGTVVDISRLDFDAIERHFLKTENKRTVVQEIRTQIEQKLNRMIDANPLRIDFQERYEAIIEEYNHGKERVTIEHTFQQLISFVENLNEEDARASREGLEESQLAIFDLLRKGKKLSTKEQNKVKAIAKQLLEALLQNELKAEHWAHKSQTRGAVETVVQNYLFEQLPYPAYEQEDIDSKAVLVVDFLKARFGDGAAA